MLLVAKSVSVTPVTIISIVPFKDPPKLSIVRLPPLLSAWILHRIGPVTQEQVIELLSLPTELLQPLLFLLLDPQIVKKQTLVGVGAADVIRMGVVVATHARTGGEQVGIVA